ATPIGRSTDRALADVHVAILRPAPGRCLPPHGGGVTAGGGNDEKMQEIPENTRRTRAQQGAESALAAVDTAIGIGDGAIGFARSMVRSGRPLLDSVVSPVTSAAAPIADRTRQAWPQPWLRQAAARGREDREALTSAVVRLVL